jgi:thiosulfate reductase cytochrome b subunit
MTAVDNGHGGMKGVTRLGSHSIVTTGLLGASTSPGRTTERGFPAWATLPSFQDLATGRAWHFFLAWLFVFNGLTYLAFGAISGHFRRDVVPAPSELTARYILHDIWDHLRFKHPTGDAAKHYNTLQKLTYVAVIFLLLPTMVLTGLTMSPGMDAVAPFLLDLFGGRQSARSLHFITATLIVFFVFIHVAEVFIAGVWNEIRSMITGWYEIKPDQTDEPL